MKQGSRVDVNTPQFMGKALLVDKEMVPGKDETKSSISDMYDFGWTAFAHFP